MKTLVNIEELTKHLIPLTYFRRNAGEILAKLEKMGTFILTKDGKPIAKLSTLRNETSKEENQQNEFEKVKKVVGGFHFGRITPKKIKKIIY